MKPFNHIFSNPVSCGTPPSFENFFEDVQTQPQHKWSFTGSTRKLRSFSESVLFYWLLKFRLEPRPTGNPRKFELTSKIYNPRERREKSSGGFVSPFELLKAVRCRETGPPLFGTYSNSPRACTKNSLVQNRTEIVRNYLNMTQQFMIEKTVLE